MLRLSLRLCASAFILFFVVFLPAPTHAQTEEDDIIRNINQFRASLGLPAFTYNPQLAIAAQNQADYLADVDVFTHTGYGGSRPIDRANAAGYSGWVSENIVGGWRMTPADGVVWWRNSPPHYRTITSTRYVEIGAGFSQGHEKNFYTIVVGLPSDAPSYSQVSQSAVASDQSAPLIITPISLAPAADDGSITHIIQGGQALWSLAAYYKVDIGYIYRINGLNEGDFVQPGDEIRIRLGDGEATPTPLPTATPIFYHRVQEGETPWEIAARYGVDIDELLRANNKPENGLLTVGENLLVRWEAGSIPPRPTATPQYYYTIVEGDTLWTLAANNGLTLEELYALNGFDANTYVQPGTEVLIRALPTEIINSQQSIVNAQLPTETPPAPSLQPPTPTLEVIEIPTVAQVAVEVVDVVESADTPTPIPPTTIEEPPTTQSSPITNIALPIGLVMVAILLGVIGFMLWRGETNT